MGGNDEGSRGVGEAGALLARLQQNSDHFAGLSADKGADAADTAVRMIRSTLACRQALVLVLTQDAESGRDGWEMRAESGCDFGALDALHLDDLTMRLAHAAQPVSLWGPELLPDDLIGALHGCGLDLPLAVVALRRLAESSDEVFALCIAGGAEGPSGFREPELQALQILGSVVGGSLLFQAARTQLLEAKEQAELAMRAKTDFLATMSHELRTPMNGVLVMARLLVDAGLDVRHQRRAEVITDSAESLLRMIDDILEFSTAEQQAVSVHPQPFSLRSLVQAVVAEVGVAAGEGQVRLWVDIPDDLPDSLVGDAARIRRVLCNLSGNALKFTREGEVRVAVEDRGRTPRGHGLRFVVADTGIGIHADWLERIFDRFTQVDSSATRSFGGAGLGLALCKTLVEAMGGSLGVESTHGEGSTFWFELDLQPQSGAALPEPSQAGTDASAARETDRVST